MVWGQLPFAQIWYMHHLPPHLICGHTRQDFFLKHPNLRDVNKCLGWLQYILTELEDASHSSPFSMIWLIFHERIYLIWDMHLDHQLVHHPVFEHHAAFIFTHLFHIWQLTCCIYIVIELLLNPFKKWLTDSVQVDDVSHGTIGPYFIACKVHIVGEELFFISIMLEH